jgi:uncharacterized protein (UPF0210 family)
MCLYARSPIACAQFFWYYLKLVVFCNAPEDNPFMAGAFHKKVGDWVEFGGLLGRAPVIAVNTYSCADFINRGGHIPPPIHSFRN